MINDLDKTLENLFQLERGMLVPFDLSFAIPDKNFAPISKTRNTLSCYLYEIIEDRELRRVDPVFLRKTDGTMDRVLPPARIKVSYCITAWSSAQPTPGGEPQLDEHTLLSQVLLVLLKYPVLPVRVLAGELAKQDPPPTMIVIPETSKATNDFWSAIGGQLRPSLDYKVTIELAYQEVVTSPIVTTMRTTTRLIDMEGTGQTLYRIGGTVYASNSPSLAIAAAQVHIKETKQTSVADEQGRFIMEHLGEGNYTLLVSAVGFKDGLSTISIPPGQGNAVPYDIMLDPL